MKNKYVFIFAIVILLVSFTIVSYSKPDTRFSASSSIKDITKEIIFTQDYQKSEYLTDNIFIKNKEASCSGSVCSFEFNINNPSGKDRKLDANRLKLWYLKQHEQSSVNKFVYYQWIEKIHEIKEIESRECIVDPDNPANISCSVSYLTKSVSQSEWQEINLQKITLKANSINKFRVEGYFSPVIGENTIDWKIAIDDNEIGYAEPDWILFNASKNQVKNITFTNVQSMTREAEPVVVFLNLNATVNITIGFTAKNIYFNGQNYSMGWLDNTLRGIDDLQLVNDSFTPAASEVAFIIYNATSGGSYLTTRNYTKAIANVSYLDTGAYDIFGNNRIMLKISETDGGVDHISVFGNTINNNTCEQGGTDNCIAVYDSTNAYVLGGTSANTCSMTIDTDAMKRMTCSGAGANIDNFNYTIYEGVDYAEMTFTDSAASYTGSNVFYATSGLWGSNQHYYYVNGSNYTSTRTTSTGFSGSSQNISMSIRNDTYVDYWLWGLPGNYGNLFNELFQDRILIGSTTGNAGIPGGSIFRNRYGFFQSGLLNSSRATTEWNKFINPLKSFDTTIATGSTNRFGLCNSTLTSLLLNVTFADEINSTKLNASVSDGSINYPYDAIETRTFTFSNSTPQLEYDFCSDGNNNITIDITSFSYKFLPVYPIRGWSETLNLNLSQTTNKTLYLLATGTPITFQILNSASQPLSDVLGTAKKGSLTVESKISDAAGLIQFSLDQSTSYTLTFSKDGYITNTQTITPVLTTYTISMQSVSLTGTNTSTSQGISYIISPGNLSLNNGTNYTFSFDIKSSYWNLQLYGFNMTNSSGFFYGKITGTGSAGSKLSMNINTGNESAILMNYYWIVNNTYANGTKSWVTFNEYNGTGSILRFCNDLSNFSRGGFDSFGRALIAFIIIFIIAAGISFYSGIYSPVAIVGVIAAGITFFDFCGSLIPNPVNAVPHFTSIIIGLLFIGLIIDKYITTR